HYIPESNILRRSIGWAVQEKRHIEAKRERFCFFKYAPFFDGSSKSQSGIYAHITHHRGRHGMVIFIQVVDTAEFYYTHIGKSIGIYMQPVAGKLRLPSNIVVKIKFEIEARTASSFITDQQFAVALIRHKIAGIT